MKMKKLNEIQISGKTAFIVISLFLIFIVVGISNSPNHNGQIPPTSTNDVPEKQITREDIIESGFSSWDGSHIELKQYVRDAMADRKSFEHRKTLYVDKGDYLVVSMEFAGKNAFGGMVIQTIYAKCSLDGKILEILTLD